MTSSFEPEADDPVGRTRFVANPLFAAAEPFRSSAAAPAAPEEPPEAAEARLQEALREAFEAGRSEGRAELPWSEAEALESSAAALATASRSLADLQSRYLRAQRHAVVELALGLARRILERELASDPEALLALLERALTRLPEGEAIQVRLAARDHATLAQGEPPRLHALAETSAASFAIDPALSPGECRLEAGATSVDGRLTALLAPLREVLLALADSDPDAPGGTPAPAPEQA